MNELLHQTLSLRASGHVRRWHTLSHLGQQTVAEHSAQALTILFMLHPAPSVNLIKTVLFHDHAERYVGDVPAPVLYANEEYRAVYDEMEMSFFQNEMPFVYDAIADLNDEDRLWAKGVDILELILWCEDQIMLGNQHAKIVGARGKKYLREKRGMPDEILAFLETFEEEGMRSFA